MPVAVHLSVARSAMQAGSESAVMENKIEGPVSPRSYTRSGAYLQTKLEASFVLPFPIQVALAGNGQSGRVIKIPLDGLSS